MAKYKRDFNKKKYQQFLKENRGKGKGNHYKPWLRVQDVASTGNVYRLRSAWTHNREVHLFSTLELKWFFIFDWDTQIIDIREQYPLLPLEHTQAIAEELGYRHPTNSKTQYPVVMTSDFCLTVRQSDGSLAQKIRTIKRFETLDNSRIREKFAIEHIFWQRNGISDWRVATDDGLNLTLAKNIEILRGYVTLDNRLKLPPQKLLDTASFLTDCLNTSKTPLIKAAKDSDHKFCLPGGSSLTIAYFLLANRYWEINMDSLINPHSLCTLQQHNLQQLKMDLQRTYK